LTISDSATDEGRKAHKKPRKERRAAAAATPTSAEQQNKKPAREIVDAEGHEAKKNQLGGDQADDVPQRSQRRQGRSSGMNPDIK